MSYRAHMDTSKLTQEMKRHAVLVALAANHGDSEIAAFLNVARSFVLFCPASSLPIARHFSHNLFQKLQPRHLRFLMPKVLIWVALLALCCDGKEKPKDEPSSVLYEDHNSKRSPQLYSFGLGKKSAVSDLLDEYEVPAYQEVDDDDIERQSDMKRDGKFERYSFGLGKKAVEPSRFAFGLGKRGSRDSPTSRFSFGLGKRMDQRYAFGLGKREPSRYAFGLGKRESNDELEEYIKRRFSFGLGKRAVDPRFAFGLGRRKKADASYMI